jgi:hypothetical protein
LNWTKRESGGLACEPRRDIRAEQNPTNFLESVLETIVTQKPTRGPAKAHRTNLVKKIRAALVAIEVSVAEEERVGRLTDAPKVVS